MGILLLATAAYAVLTAAAPRVWAVSIPQMALFTALLVLSLKRPIRVPLFLLVPVYLATLGGLQWVAHSTVSRSRTADAAIDWAGYAVVALLAAQPLLSRDQFLRSWTYFAGVCGALAIVTALTSPFHIFWFFPVRFEQVFGPYVYRNHLAAFAELSLPVALTLAIRDRERRPVFAVIAAVLLSAVVIAQSRTGLVLLAAEVIVLLGLASYKRWLAPKAAILIFSALLGGAAIAGMSGVAARFAEDHPYRVRFEILQSTVDMANARPVTGWGLGNFRNVYPQFARIDPGVLVNEAHNDWAQWAAEAGFPAAVMMLLFAAWSLKAGLRTGWALGMFAVFCHALVDYPFEEPSVVFLLMLLAGLASSDPALTESRQWHRHIARRRSHPTTQESLPA